MTNNLISKEYPYPTLVDMLQQRSEAQADEFAFTFLNADQNKDKLTYRELEQQARAIGATLQQMDAAGERVLLMYQPGLAFIAAFFGCLYAGAVAVPAYPPRLNRPMPRLRSIVADTQARFVLTNRQIHSKLAQRLSNMPDLAALSWIATDDLAGGVEATWQKSQLNGETLAFLQYTSGSTAAPKGVMISHRNALFNLSLIDQGFGTTVESRGLFWLPPYHDMGLISLLHSVYCGGSSALMSPATFLQRPLGWLEAISNTQATISGGPNFAYDLCVRRMATEENPIFDLSHWQVAFNGAEPVRAETLRQFAETFKPYGFRPEAFYPCYGLAETTLFAAGGSLSETPVVKAWQGSALTKNKAIPASADDEAQRVLVGCGQTLPGQTIRIVNPETLRSCPPDQIGEIWLAGSSVAQGYWGRAEETQQTFTAYLTDSGEGPFLRTGDLGFLADGELFISGRRKDLIIIRGRNYYPQDIELTVQQSHAGLQPDGGVAFSIETETETETEAEEQLVIVQEVTRQNRRPNIDEVAQAIRQAVSTEHDVSVYAVVLIKPGRLPRTSSGKVQRYLCRAKFQADELAPLGVSRLTTELAPRASHSLQPSPLQQALLQLDPETQQSELTTQLQTQIGQMIGLPPDQLSPTQPLQSFGFDSLMLFELKARLETELGVMFPADQFQQVGTIRWLVQQALAQWTTEPADKAQPVWPEQGCLTGPVPLTPIQRYFFREIQIEPNHWNGTLLMELDQKLKSVYLEEALGYILTHHDTLHLRFKQSEDGSAWQQHYALPDQPVPFTRIDLAGLEAGEQQTTITATMQKQQTLINLSHGPLLHIIYFECGPHQPDRLLIIIHHLVFDGLSALVLFQDILRVYQQLEQGQPARLPPKTASYRAWAERLQEYAQSSEQLQAEAAYWLNPARAEIKPLPVDHRSGPNLDGTEQAVDRILSQEDSLALLKKAQEADGAGIEAILLTALAQTCQRWAGQAALLVELERHGRVPLFDDIDLTRTVGFFNNRAPILLDIGQAQTPVESLGLVASQLRQVPNQGLGYGLLRYLSNDNKIVSALESLPQPEIKVNYFGQLINRFMQISYEAMGVGKTRITHADIDVSPHNIRPRLFSIGIFFMGPLLRIVWFYSENLHRQETVKRLMDDFVSVLSTLGRQD